MRLIVDEMPKDTLDCPFGKIISSLYSNRIEQTKCGLADGGPCELKDRKCPWLKVLYGDVEQAENFYETYQKLLGDTYCNDTMKELIEWLSPTEEMDYDDEKK